LRGVREGGGGRLGLGLLRMTTVPTERGVLDGVSGERMAVAVGRLVVEACYSFIVDRR